MSQNDKLVKILEQEQQRLSQEVADLEQQDPSRSGFRDINNTEDDDAAESEDHSRVQAQLEVVRSQLADVQLALKKHQAGTYGKCERCGKPIPEARLKAMPWAIYDVECEEIIDSGAR